MEGFIMELNSEQHRDRIRSVGKVLWVLSWIWIVLNAFAFVVVFGVMAFFTLKGGSDPEFVANFFAQPGYYPGLDKELVQKLSLYDLQFFLDHGGWAYFYMSAASAVFLVYMFFILRLAKCWKNGDVFGTIPLKTLNVIGWIFTGHGIVSMFVECVVKFIAPMSNSMMMYFSFVYDVAGYSFSFAPSAGFIIGIVFLALSRILENARMIKLEQDLTV